MSLLQTLNLTNHLSNNFLGVPLIVNTTKSVSGGDVLVVWEPPLVGACPVVKYNVYYREVMSSARQQGNWYSVELDGSHTSCTLHLSCRKEYNVSVTSISESGESPFNDSKIWNFQTTGGNNLNKVKLWSRLHWSCNGRSRSRVGGGFLSLALPALPPLDLPLSCKTMSGMYRKVHQTVFPQKEKILSFQAVLNARESKILISVEHLLRLFIHKSIVIVQHFYISKNYLVLFPKRFTNTI